MALSTVPEYPSALVGREARSPWLRRPPSSERAHARGPLSTAVRDARQLAGDPMAPTRHVDPLVREGRRSTASDVRRLQCDGSQ